MPPAAACRVPVAPTSTVGRTGRAPGSVVRHVGRDPDDPARQHRPHVVRAGRAAGGSPGRRTPRPDNRNRSASRSAMTSTRRGVPVQLMIALMCAALLAYIVLLGRTAILMIGSGRGVAIALGAALLILPAMGLWAMIATLRAGLAHQKLARLAAEDGMELDVSALPRRPSGRIERDAADALFDTVRRARDIDPHDWRRWYRLGPRPPTQ